MAYEQYTIEKVFNNDLVNILCNKILDRIHTEFPASETKLVATMDLAKIIQGAPLVELPVVTFVTNDMPIYGYLVQKLQQIISVETQLSFTNRIQVVTAQAHFEFWYDAAFVNAVNVNGVYARDILEL